MSQPTRVGVVTGAGRGFGRATAGELARRGFSLALCARTESEITAVAREISALDVDVIGQVVDVTSDADVASFADRIVERWGHVTLLINNAAQLGPVGSLGTAGNWTATFDVNVVASVRMINALRPALAGGSIVNVSGAGVGGDAIDGRAMAYAVSKSAIVGMTEALAATLAVDGININAIAPGLLPTTLNDPLHERYGMPGDQNATGPIDPRPFVDLVLFLVDGVGRRITGRLLATRWDRPKGLASRLDDIITSSLFRLRRIDDELYTRATP